MAMFYSNVRLFGIDVGCEYMEDFFLIEILHIDISSALPPFIQSDDVKFNAH